MPYRVGRRGYSELSNTLQKFFGGKVEPVEDGEDPIYDEASDTLQQFFGRKPKTDRDILAETAIGEARGEGEEGMAAVMHAVLNRRDRTPGATIEDIVTAPKQFSMYNPGDPNLAVAENYEDKEAVLALAQEIMKRKNDPTGGATHYFAHERVNPEWADALEHTTTIGSHKFMREPKRRKK